MANKTYTNDGVFVVPAPRNRERSDFNQDRRSVGSVSSDVLSLNSTQSLLAVSTQLKDTDGERLVEHIESYIKVLKARQQFVNTQKNKRDSLSKSDMRVIDVDITRNNYDYNKNVHGLFNEIETKQLQANTLNRAIGSTIIMNFQSVGLRKQSIIEQLLVQFAKIMHEESVVKMDLLNLQREVINKQNSSIDYIDTLLKVPKIEQQKSELEESKYTGSKVRKMNYVSDILNCFLSEIDEQILFSDPKLLEILKKPRQPSWVQPL